MSPADLSRYAGREQAFVKHSLLQQYIPTWVYKVGRAWDKLVFVDAFAGPWQTTCPNLSDTSFAVAITEMQKAIEGQATKGIQAKGQCIMVGDTNANREELEGYAAKKRRPGFDIQAVQGKFADAIPQIEQLIAADKAKAFKFVFLDPKGWGDIPMDKISPFVQSRSSEVLVNLMTKYINRFLDQADRADSYRRLFGRDDVLDVLQKTPKAEKAERAVSEYGHSLKRLCGFRYVSSAVVLEPEKEEVIYYLVFATNDPKGVIVFKDAEMRAAKTQDMVRLNVQTSSEGQDMLALDGDQKSHLVHKLRQRYLERAHHKTLVALLKNTDANGALYSELFCEAMAFPLVTPDDLRAWIKCLGAAVEVVLFERKKGELDPSRDDRVILRDPIKVVGIKNGLKMADDISASPLSNDRTTG